MKIERQHSKYILFFLVAGFSLLLIYSITTYYTQAFADDASTQTTQYKRSETTNNHKEIIKESLVAKTYIIYDINEERIVRSKDAITPLPLASLTKIITVATLLNTAKKNNINIQDSTKFHIQKALVSSSNDDAEWLGIIYQSSFGKDLVADTNNFLSSIGISDTTVTNLTGLDNYDGTASNTGSPQSIAKIFAYLYKNHRDIFEYTKFENLETDSGVIKNTNKISEETFGIMASKTGFTYEAGGNLGVIISPEPGSSYVILVMNSTKEGRFHDMSKLAKLLPIILKERAD